MLKSLESIKFVELAVLANFYRIPILLSVLLMKRSILLALVVSATALPFRPSFAESIRDSVDRAVSAHPSIEAALAGKVVAKEEYRETRSGLYPEFSANVSAGRIFGDNSTSRGLSVSRGTAYSNLGEGSASLRQPLFDGMETFNRMDAAQARTESADYNVADVQESLALRAVQAHLTVMQAQEILDETKAYHSVIKDYLDRIQLMVDEGVADESETAQAENISLMLESTVTDYEGQLNAAYALYKEVIGQMPMSDLQKPSVSLSVIEEDVDRAINFAKINHPLVRSGEKDLEAAGYDVKAEYGGYYPDIDGELSYLKRDQKEEIGGEVVDARALLKMSWEFETGGAQTARTKKTRAQYSEILAQNREVIRTIEGDIRRAYAEYETAKKQMDLVKQREDVTKNLFEAYEVQFEGARVRLLQLMQAENQLFNAQLESITAEYRHLLAQYGILASTGNLLEYVSSMPLEALDRFSSVKAEEIKTTEEGAIVKVSSSSSDKLAKEITNVTK